MSDVCSLPNHLLQPNCDEIQSQAWGGIHLHLHNQSQPNCKSVLHDLENLLNAYKSLQIEKIQKNSVGAEKSEDGG